MKKASRILASLLSLAMLSALAILPVHAAETVTVDAFSGNYTGAVSPDGIISFRNIKYATAERWQEAVPAVESDEDFDCTGDVTVIPYQRGDLEMTEDYLTLDIYSSANRTEENCPVLVCVNFGGGSSSNSNGADFSEFLTEYPNLIIVNVNMRVAFFCSIDLSIFDDYADYGDIYAKSNNLSRLDFVTSLAWVKQNIAAFGGDPANVTLQGGSGGAVMASTPLIIPDACQYVSKIIMSSGVTLDTISVGTVEESRALTEQFVEFTGVKSLKEALELDPTVIVQAQQDVASKCIGAYYPGNQSKTFTNVIDNVVIYEDYLETMKESCEKYGIKIIAVTSDGEYDRDLSKATLKLDENASEEEWAAAALKNIVSANWAKLDPEQGGAENAYDLIQGYVDRGEAIGRNIIVSYEDLKNDINQKCSAVMICELWDALGADAYLGSYNYNADENLRGMHAVSMRPVVGKLETTDPEMGKAWRAAVVSFMKTGDPNAENPYFEADGVVWNKFDTETHEEMILDTGYSCQSISETRWEDINSLLPLFKEYPAIQEMLSALEPAA